MKNPVEMPDEKLIQFYLCNNPLALATLTDLYKDRIYSAIYATVKDKYAAEQVFKDVFVRIINNMMAGKGPEETTFLNWALDTAQLLSIEYNYKSGQHAIHNLHCEDGLTTNEQREVVHGNMYYDNHNRLRKVIHMLPDGQREVMILNHYAGVSFREIAAKMKCSVSVALDTMKLALINLRSMMLENEAAA